MNSKSLRRLAADHGSLHTAGLPPNYLFAPESDDAADLTSLDVLLAGPVGTPYAGGVWRLHLDIPPTYPAAPPTAQFRTRLWHPNIDEATGAVCVETLKRDWSSTLKLRDVLVTISCLLIQPNPASALNEAAGKLAVEDWDGYCRRAKLMTEIHAAIPSSIAKEVREAQMRGEEQATEPESQSELQPQPTAKPHSKGKEKERVKITPAGPRLQRRPSEDEENRRRRAATHDADSDPESDWIPGPVKTSKVPGRQEPNIFGIKGLEDTMQLDTPPKRIFAAQTKAPISKDKGKTKGPIDDSDPFITTAPSKSSSRPVTRSFDLAAPPLAFASTLPPPLPAVDPSTSNDDDDSTATLLLRDFSLSWHDTFALHNNDPDAKKRIASPEFEAKSKWEIKRFRQAGCDLKKFNRGEFGARVGLGRL